MTSTNFTLTSTPPLSGTPTITAQKLNWKKYLSWSGSDELWSLGQGHYDHLEKEANEIPAKSRNQ